MKMAHISDLHLNTEHKPKNLYYTQKLIEHALQQNIHHLVITGDITHNASEEDFKHMRRLLESFGLLHSQKVSLVIGNHDIFGGVHLAEDILTFPDRCRTVDDTNKIKQFQYYFYETFLDCYHPFKSELFPYAKIIGDIVLIGMNSIAPYSTIKNLFASKGRVDKLHLQGLRQISQWNKVKERLKVVLIHHHFGLTRKKEKQNLLENIENHHMKLRKRKKIIRIFQSLGVDLVLHGHVHISNQYHKKGIHFVNAGATVEGFQRDFLYINFIEIAQQHIRVDIQQISKSSFHPVHTNKNTLIYAHESL